MGAKNDPVGRNALIQLAKVLCQELFGDEEVSAAGNIFLIIAFTAIKFLHAEASTWPLVTTNGNRNTSKSVK